EPFHIREILAQFGKTAAQVKVLRVLCHQQPTAQALKRRISEDRLYQPLPEPIVALLCDDKDVGKIREGCLIGDDAGEADLRAIAIEAERHRMSERAAQRVERDIARPVRALGEKMMG